MFSDFSEVVRCISFLCHDLGYPLERIKRISIKISEILNEFQIREDYQFGFSIMGGLKKFLNEIISYISGIFIYTKDNKLLFNRDQLIYTILVLNSETYEHGLMSALILSQKVNCFLSNSLKENTEVNISEFEFLKSYCKYKVLKSIVLHETEIRKVKNLYHLEDLLKFIDFIEEFKRMSRASMYGTRIREFCKSRFSFSSKNEGESDLFIFEICYIFESDKKRAKKLNPEKFFKEKGLIISKSFDFEDKDLIFKLKVINPITVKDKKSKSETIKKQIYELTYRNNSSDPISLNIDGFKNNEVKKGELEKAIKKSQPSYIIREANMNFEKE